MPLIQAELFSRIRRLYHDGWPGLAAAVDLRRRRFRRNQSPVAWARFGAASRALGRAWPTLQPAVVVLSLPRSGSSWVGHTLGLAANAAYLREPLDQLFLARRGREPLHDFDPARPPRAYREAAALCFAGVPAFPRWLPIVSSPGQWGLADRRRRRVVIKLVNPFVAPWLLRAYPLRLIYLVRHPAALALSFRRMGWWNDEPDHWLRVGRHFHAAHRALLDAAAVVDTAGHTTLRVVDYESLCREPLDQFRQLYNFAGLTWDERVAARVAEQTSGGDEADPYSVARNSRAQVDRWRREIQPHELAELQSGYCHAPLPWYQAAQDWSLAS